MPTAATTRRILLGGLLLACAAGAGRGQGLSPLPAGAVARLGEPRFYHGAMITWIAYSPDGRFLASADRVRRRAGWIRVFDAETGRQLCRIRDEKQQGFWCLTFADGGDTLISLGGDGSVTGWDPQTGRRKWTGEYRSAGSGRIDAAHDADLMVHGNLRESMLWGLEDHAVARKYGRGDLVAISADGGVVALAAASGSISGVRIIEPRTGRPLKILGPSGDGISDLVLSADGQRVAASIPAEGIRVWQADTGKQELAIDSKRVVSLAISADGRRLASVSRAGSMDLWDLRTGERTHTIRLDSSGPVVRAAFSPDGQTVAAGAGSWIRRWSVTTGAERRGGPGHAGSVVDVAFSPDGSRLASGSTDGTVRLWGLPGGEAHQRIDAHEQPVSAVAFAPGGGPLTTGSADGTVRLWTPDADPLGVADEAFVPVLLGFSADGAWLRGVSPDGEVRAWPVRAEALAPSTGGGQNAGGGPTWRRRRAARGRISSVAFGPRGRLLALTEGHRVSVWDLRGGHQQASLVTRGVPAPRDCAIGPFEQYVVTTSGVELSVIEILTEREVLSIPSARPNPQAASVACAPVRAGEGTGRLFAVSDADGAVMLYDLATAAEVYRWTGHDGPVRTLAFGPAGRLLASGGDDGTVLVWNTASASLPPVPAAAGQSAGLPGRGAVAADSTSLELLWDRLASLKGREAFDAGWALVAAGDTSAEFLSRKLRATPALDPPRVEELIGQLADPRWARREQAQTDLATLGMQAEPALQAALARSDSMEVRMRIEALLDGIRSTSRLPGETVRLARAVHVLERIGGPRAVAVLTELAAGAPAALQTRQAALALGRMEDRP